MGLWENLKRGALEFVRIWGFSYPRQALILQTAQGGRTTWENFKISDSVTAEDKAKYLEAIKKMESKKREPKADAAPDKSPTKNKAKPEPEKEKGPEDKKKSKKLEDYVTEEDLGELKTSLTSEEGLSVVTNEKTNESVLICGQVGSYFRSSKPATVFPNLVISVFLPILIFTEVWQIALIQNWVIVDWQAALFGAVALTLALHNGRYAFFSSISALYCTRKLYVSAMPIYVPNLINFLTVKEVTNEDIKSDAVANLMSELTPLRFRAKELKRELGEAYAALQHAGLVGELRGLILAVPQKKQTSTIVLVVLGIVLGIVIGFLLSSGLSYTTATQTTVNVTNINTTRLILGGI